MAHYTIIFLTCLYLRHLSAKSREASWLSTLKTPLLFSSPKISQKLALHLSSFLDCFPCMWTAQFNGGCRGWREEGLLVCPAFLTPPPPLPLQFTIDKALMLDCYHVRFLFDFNGTSELPGARSMISLTRSSWKRALQLQKGAPLGPHWPISRTNAELVFLKGKMTMLEYHLRTSKFVSKQK